MIFSVILVAMALGVSGQSLSDTLLQSVPDSLISIVGSVISLNGPTSISEASTSPSLILQPKVDEMRYYNYYAQSAYCSDQLKGLNCDICRNFKSDIDTDGLAILKNDLFNTLAFVTVSRVRQEIVVTFRGTVTDLRHYLLNAALFNAGTNNIKFHGGFYVATMSLYEDVIVSVGYQQKLHPTYKIVLTGHSLGGAMARLTLYFIKTRNQFPGVACELYTYGEPRVGNKPFADYFNKLVYKTGRCVNKRDVVPHTPPTSILGTTVLHDFYVQPQLENWITDDGIQLCDANFYEDPKCSNSVDTYTVTDHSTYFKVVGNCSETVATTAPLPSNPPPMPNKISNFAGGAITFLLNILS